MIKQQPQQGAYPTINTLQSYLNAAHIIRYCCLVPPTYATGCNAMRQTSAPFHFTLLPMLHRMAHRTTKQQGPHPTPYLPTHTMLGDKLRKNICIYLLLAVALSRQTRIYPFDPQLRETCFACLHLLYCISHYPYMANCYT